MFAESRRKFCMKKLVHACPLLGLLFPRKLTRVKSTPDPDTFEKYRATTLHAQYGWTDRGARQWKLRRKFRIAPRLHPLHPLVLYYCFKGVETEGILDYQGRARIISIVRWNLRPVIFGVKPPLSMVIPLQKNTSSG